MAKIVSVKLDEKLFNRLNQLTKIYGLTKSAIIKKGITLLSSQESSTLDGDFIKNINKALRQKKAIPSKVIWDDILEELSTTAPKWKTVEEAINYTRRRR